MYLLWRAGGFPAQEELWTYLADGLVTLYTAVQGDWERMRLLMRQCRIPMDLADASLVVAAERHDLCRVFTLDSDFYAYRIEGKPSFEIVPTLR